MITSTQNQLIKELLEKKSQKNVVCLDNTKLIEEALKANGKIIKILCLQEPSGENQIQVSQNVLKKFTNTVTSQGIVALLEFEYKELKPPLGNFLILDNVQDPGNVGTLIRSAVGANFLDIYLLDCASAFSDKVIRSTMGAIFKCNVYKINFDDLPKIKSWQKNIYVADMNGQNIYDCNFEKNIGIIVGNEGHGVSQQLKNLATNLISLPMQNNLESLNAGVSGSIIMYQITYGGK